MKTFLLIIFIFIIIKQVNSKNELKQIFLRIYYTYEINDDVGRSGMVKFIVDPSFIKINNTYGKWNPYFDLKIFDEYNISYIIKCGPWKPDNTFYIFCKLDENIKKGNYFFEFKKNENVFNFSGYNINLISFEKRKVIKVDKDIIDLYSYPQIINVNENEDIYELKFYILSYNKQTIFRKTAKNEYIPLNCNKNDDELICIMNKIELVNNINREELRPINKNNMEIFFLNEKGQFEKFNFISSININYFIQSKIDIYVKITKLLTDQIILFSNFGFIFYETNITSIPNINTKFFYLFFIGTNQNYRFSCGFKSGEFGPVLLLCKKLYLLEDGDILYLKEIKNNNPENNINIKYNFIILPTDNNEKINVINNYNIYDYAGINAIYKIYPSILNFTLNDSLIIDIHVEKPRDVSGLTFNENNGNLICINLVQIKRCKISKNHFNNMNKEYYYIKYDNNLDFNSKSISYYTNPIRVILPNNINIDADKTNIKKHKIKKNDIGINSNNKILISGLIIIIICFALYICFLFYFKDKKNLQSKKSKFSGEELNEVIM